jgi:hypothetical protein
MPPPFDAHQFFAVFERYNLAIWPVQMTLILAALVAVGLAVRPRAGSGRVVSIILGGLWLWMGVVYHLMFFRPINPAAVAFGTAFVLEGLLLLILGGWLNRIRFVWAATTTGVMGAVLITYALVLYPVLGFTFGHRYPAAPTFGLPCPTTIFTLGLLAWAAPPRPWSLLVLPLTWSALGASAAVYLGIWEDLGLVAAGGLTVALAMVQHFRGPEHGRRRTIVAFPRGHRTTHR